MIDPAKPLILIDGSSYLYRAFHALPPLSNSRGEPTGAVYGVVAMLKRLVNDYAPEYMAVVFDAKGKTFRSDLYADYKATRPPMPDDLAAQIEPLHELVRALGLPLLMEPGLEADDVIGTLTCRAVDEGMSVLIATGDKDMAQLVNDSVSLVNSMDGTRLDRQGVIDKFGLPPECIVDYLALTGDKVDNIPGVPGVGPKTAVKWLAEHRTLDGVIAAADRIKGKIGEKLRAALDDLPLSYQLATIECNARLDYGPRDLALKPPDIEQLRTLYERLEFRKWRDELGESENATEATGQVPAPAERVEYELVRSRSVFDHWLQRLQEAELIAFDTETDRLDYMRAQIVGVSFAVTPGEAAYVPVGHDYPGAPEQLDRDTVLQALRPLLEDPHKPKLGQNLKFDRSVLANHGIQLQGIVHDTMLESYVLDSTASRHDLDTLCERHLGHQAVRFEDVAGKGVKQIPFSQVPLEDAGPYAAEDADMALRLHGCLWPKLQAVIPLQRLYEDIEIPLIPVLSGMERTGVRIDAGRLLAYGKELAERISKVESKAFEVAGGPFNLGSPQQIQAILYDRQGLPVKRKTPKGAPSTAEDVLAELALEYPLPRLILEHRGLIKLKSTYTDRLVAQINPDTGRVHTSYHQAVTSTGRLSSSDPNLQNIPIRTEAGRRIRQAFVAPPGHVLLAADYSQIELRIMAHLSGDAGLRGAFEENLDVHRATAAEVFGVTVDAVTNEQRRIAKTINFGLIYGMSAFGLARELSVTRPVAQEYVNRYFERYPDVRRYMDETRELARRQGYVETVFGRRLYLPEIKARNAQRRQYAERTAINAPMQGTAADIIKRAMIDLHAWLMEEKPPARMILQVHDELVFEVEPAAAETVGAEIARRMAAAGELAVPLVAETGTGHNWDESH